jgi:hypothetical protein
MANFEAFKKRAEEKGFKFVLDTGNEINVEEPTELHIDMVMVDLSIKSAIRNVKSESFKKKLETLSTSGTNAQKIDFVYGSGSYYFPEDLEMLANRSLSGVREDGICHKVCEVVLTEICRCLLKVNEQICRMVARKICGPVCD